MSGAVLEPAIQRWFDTRTLPVSLEDPGSIAQLAAASGASIGVCLPSLNEEATVGLICDAIRSELMERHGLVDRLIVVDSGSTDRTTTIAQAAGAEVLAADPAGGKGLSLWTGLRALDTDLVVWIDSDIRNFEPRFVTGLVSPLLRDPGLVFTKAFYERPIERTDGSIEGGGARVTELSGRPLLGLMFPEMAGFVQPLAGEYAARRSSLAELSLFSGYGVDVGLLIDVVMRFGLDATAQVDLDLRVHRNQDIHALGRMAHEVIRAILWRAEDHGRLKLSGQLGDELVQFQMGAAGPQPRLSQRRLEELPAIGSK